MMVKIRSKSHWFDFPLCILIGTTIMLWLGYTRTHLTHTKTFSYSQESMSWCGHFSRDSMPAVSRNEKAALCSTRQTDGALTPAVSTLFQEDHFEEPRSPQNAAAWPSAPPLPVVNSVVSYSNGAVSLPSEGRVGSHRWEMVMEGLWCRKAHIVCLIVFVFAWCQMMWFTVFVTLCWEH